MQASPSISRRGWVSTAAMALCAGTCAALDNRQPAPRFTAKTLEGEKFTNDTLMGKPVLLQFWTTWCGYCRREQGTVDDLLREFEPKGLVVLAVNVGESRKKVKHYLENSARNCRIVLTEDTNLSAMFAAKAFPLYVLIDQTGKIAGSQEGASGEMGLRRLLSKVGLEAR